MLNVYWLCCFTVIEIWRTHFQENLCW